MEHTGANPYTQGVVDFVSGLRYDAIPDEVRARIMPPIRDSFGCALYGTDLPWS
jgi:aconitate decarboxylase